VGTAMTAQYTKRFKTKRFKTIASSTEIRILRKTKHSKRAWLGPHAHGGTTGIKNAHRAVLLMSPNRRSRVALYVASGSSSKPAVSPCVTYRSQSVHV